MLWLPLAHVFFQPPAANPDRAPSSTTDARALMERHLKLWELPPEKRREVFRMRRGNPEWDFMGRTFLVGALANLALRDPGEKKRALAVMDRVIHETLVLEKKRGMHYFLLPYSRAGKFLGKTPGNQFLDGEIAFMLAARRLVAEHTLYKRLLRERVRRIKARMEESPVLSAESYPDESWMFCNTVALAALRMHDRLDGTDHAAFFRRWVLRAQASLTEKSTGLLVSSFTFDGKHLDGPEGSSIWMSAHMLQVIDPAFAAKQYRLARKELGRELLGFGYAREWPKQAPGPQDVDSGLVVPLLQAGPGSSGLAFVGAAAFGDEAFLTRLKTSLAYAAFPMRENGGLRYAASNQVGDAVMLYALLQGPLWKKVGPPKSPAVANNQITR